jgi:molybdate transport system substrate-binding protein
MFLRRTLAALILLLVPIAVRAALAPPELLVFGAASLTEALQDLGRSYQAKTGEKVIFSFAGSSDLARQILQGAPADVFFSADTARMDMLERAGLVLAADRRQFLSNRLVIVVPAESRTKVASPEDLPSLPRIALADPAAVPAGIYAKQWLEQIGLWPRVAPKVVPMLDVRAALAAVDTAAVPAAIVYSTDAPIAKSARVAFAVKNGPEILYSVAPIAASKNPARARDLVSFLAGPAGRAEFARRGFLLREAAP